MNGSQVLVFEVFFFRDRSVCNTQYADNNADNSTSTHQSNISTVEVDQEDGDDAVSELDVSSASAGRAGVLVSTDMTSVALSAATGTSGEVSAEDKRILTVWDFQKVERVGFNKISGEWKCHWCKNEFRGWNATKAVNYLLSTNKSNVKGCLRKIDDQAMAEYIKLRDRAQCD
jgi:hypothetical protein